MKTDVIMDAVNKLYLTIIGLVLWVNTYAQIYQIPITNSFSLVRVGMNPHPTEQGDTALAYTLLGAIDHRDADSLKYVCKAYKEKAINDTMKEKSWSSLAYILQRMLQEEKDGAVESEDVLTEDLYHYFTDNECLHLKNYLVIKYELNHYRPRSVKEHINQRTFYDDLLMFNDPNRSAWDKTADIMKQLPIKKGDKVVDVGCGFGYNAYRLLNLVGNVGEVYATDTEQSYIDHLAAVMQKNGIKNLKAVHTESNALGVDNTVDCIFMSSLYHIIYTWSREDERSAFLSSVKKHLKPNGYMVIIDNVNRHGEELNNCHVDPRLVEAQLGFWGFKRVSLTNLSEQRYMMVLQRDDKYMPQVNATVNKGTPVLDITDHRSIVHIGSLDSYDITDRGIDAASYVYDFMGGGDKSLGEIAIRKYDELIPTENFGGEYSALQWLCEVKLADDAKREEMLNDPLSCNFYNKLTDDSCKVIRYYLLHKYKLGNDSIRMLSDSILELSGEVGRTHRSYLEDYILALNPRRPQWENTDSILSYMNIKSGEVIADIGCGSGFYTDRFARQTGDSGIVYAVELKDEHIKTLSDYLQSENLGNVKVIKGSEDTLSLPSPADKLFMCSLYHVMYGVVSDSSRDKYLRSLRACLKPGGELYIVDNCPVTDQTLPYHGPYIKPELISSQLYHYGFQMIDYRQIIPQRYVMTFKLKE